MEPTESSYTNRRHVVSVDTVLTVMGTFILYNNLWY